MATELITIQHTSEGLLKFILPNDMVTVDLEVLTLTVHIYTKNKNNVEKQIHPWNEENVPPPEFLKKVRETQKERTTDFLGSLLNQDLDPNLDQRHVPAHPIPNQLIIWTLLDQAIVKKDIIPLLALSLHQLGGCKHLNDLENSKCKREEISNQSVSDDGKDNHTRKRPIVHDISSDWETETDDHETKRVDTPLKGPILCLKC